MDMIGTFNAINFRGLLVYIPTVLFILIISFGILSGLRRGLRKSVILLINMVISIIISVIIFYLIFGKNFDHNIAKYTNTILGWFGRDLSDILNTESTYQNFSGYLYEVVAREIPESYVSSASLVSIISLLMALVESILRFAMVFILLIIYHVFKLLFYIIYLIFFREGRKKKKLNRAYNNGLRQTPYKRRRCLGMLVGFVRSSAVAILLFSFIGGVFFVLSGGNYSKDKEDIVVSFDEKQYDITEYYDVINRYGTVGIGKLLESVKNSEDVPIYLLAADYITRGKYEIEDDNGTIQGSLYAREELAPVVGVIKDIALTAINYNIDVSKTDDINYILDFMSKENTLDGVAFCDRLETIIDRYALGSYTLYLGQCFVQAMANSVISSVENKEAFSSRLLNAILNGDNKITAADLLNNENIKALLHFMIDVSSNYQDLDAFFSRFKSENEETLVFGIKKDAKPSDNESKAVFAVLDSADELIASLTFLNGDRAHALLSDIIILVFERMVPGYSLEGVKSVDDLYSIYNIKWRENFSKVFGYIVDAVKYVIDKEVFSVDELVDCLLTDLQDETSDGYTLLFEIVENDALGLFLNAKGFTDVVNKWLTDFNVTLPEELVYGCYTDKNGKVVYGEIYTLLTSLAGKVKNVYDIFTNDELSSVNKIGELFNKDNEIVESLKLLVDDASTNKKYSKLIHYIISDVLMNFNKFDMPLSIYVPLNIRKPVGDRTIVASEELVVMCELIGEIAPNIFVEEIDYSKLLTSENINSLMKSEILKSSLSVTAYEQIARMDELSSFIPESYILDTDQHIEQNLTKWVGSDGELSHIVNALTHDDLLNTFFQSDNLTATDLIDIVLDMANESVVEAMTSVVLNTIVTGKLEEISLGNDATIVIPEEAKIAPVDGLDRIDSSEMTNLLDILKLSGIDEVLGSTEDKTTLMIEKFVNLSTEVKQKLVLSNILNATVTSFISNQGFESGGIEYKIVIPVSSCMSNKSVAMIDYDNFNSCINAIEVLLNGNYDFAQFDFNRILDPTVIETLVSSDILSATVINILTGVLSTAKDSVNKYLVVPDAYLNADLENEFDASIWKTRGELTKMLMPLTKLGIGFDEGNNLKINESEILKIAIDAQSPDSALSTILKSDILYASISKIILDLDVLVVIDAVKTTLGEETASYNDSAELLETTIEKSELVELFSSIEKILGTDKLNSGVSIDNLSSMITVEYLNENNKFNLTTITSLLDSVIIESKIAELIVTKAEDKICIINDLSFVDVNQDNTTSYNDSIYNWLHINSDGSVKEDISQCEIRKLLDALDKLNLFSMISDTSQKFSLNTFMSLSDEQIVSVLASDVIHATFIEQFYSNESIKNSITLPEAYKIESIDIIKQDYKSIEFYKNSEIQKVIKAISVMGLNLDDLQMDVNLVFDLNQTVEGAQETKLDFVAKSDIIWLTMSEYITKTDTIKIPNREVYVTRHDDGSNMYLDVTEVAALINLINELIPSKDLTAEIDVNSILGIDADLIVASKILWYTLSTKIFEITVLNIPKQDILDVHLDEYEYVASEEIRALLAACESLNISSITADFNVNSILDARMSVVCESKILWLTISHNISSISALKIPTVTRVGVTNEIDPDGEYLSINEIGNLVKAIKALNMDDISSFDFNNILSIGSSETIWESDIIRYTASDAIFSVDLLKIQANVVEKLNDFDELFITKAEMIAFMSAIGSLDLSNINNIDVDLSKVTSCIDTLVNSSIISTTISEEMLKGGQLADETIVTQTQLYNSDLTYYAINSAEILNYVDAAKSIGFTSYTVSALPSNLSMNQIDAITNSKVLRDTYNDSLELIINNYNNLPFEDVTIETESVRIMSYVDGKFIFTSSNILTKATLEAFAQTVIS